MKRWRFAMTLAATSVLAPLGIVAWLLVVPVRTTAELVALVAVCVIWTAALHLANTWEFTSIHLRWAYAALVALASVVRLLEWGTWPTWRGVTWQLVLAAILFIEGAWMLALALSGRRRRGLEPLELRFPLEDGRFLVTDGGDSKLAPVGGQHFDAGAHLGSAVNASMRFATDIVGIGVLGSEATGFLPRDNAAYRIWERPVLAPLGGEVVHVVGDLADNSAFGPYRAQGVGNHIVVRGDGDTCVVVGHLREGSVRPAVGQRISAGEVVGIAGNSGWSDRPHVHVQAFRAPDGDWQHGEPRPITFHGRLLVRNDTLRA